MKIFSFIWNYIFERSFNMFDVMVFGLVMQMPWTWSDWQFWVTIIIGAIISQTAQLFNDRLKTLT